MAIGKQKLLAGVLTACAVVASLAPSSFAYHHRYARVYPTTTVVTQRPVYYYRQQPVYYYHREHPVLRGTVLGGAIGAGAGALGGAIAGHHRAGRGALIGLGTGAGIGAVESAGELQGHPVIRHGVSGTLLGLGIGATAHRRGWAGKGAGIGALLGSGFGLLRGSNGYL